MKIVIAPDSFKGSLTAREAADAMEQGIYRVNPDINIVKVPMADGGEGTVESLVDATGGKIYQVRATDPLGRSIPAFYGVLGDNKTCVIEVASASGLTLLNEGERNPLVTSSYGTGELIGQALDRGYRQFIIGLGGSATNDGGAGILQALGIRLLDKNGKDVASGGGNLHLIRDMDTSTFDPRIAESSFQIASDVNNPLVGRDGATHVFAPQKGADLYMIERLEENLYHFADVIEQKTGIPVHNSPGAGAAGGIGAVLQVFFKGKMRQGIDIVMEASGLEPKLKGAQLVITGEGQIDDQTIRGKTPAGVAAIARKYQIPVLAIAGSVGEGVEHLRQIGIESIISMINRPMDLQEAQTQAFSLLADAAEQAVRIFWMGYQKGGYDG